MLLGKNSIHILVIDEPKKVHLWHSFIVRLCFIMRIVPSFFLIYQFFLYFSTLLDCILICKPEPFRRNIIILSGNHWMIHVHDSNVATFQYDITGRHHHPKENPPKQLKGNESKWYYLPFLLFILSSDRNQVHSKNDNNKNSRLSFLLSTLDVIYSFGRL